MALINCPECNKEISSKAESCPNCACPINRKSDKPIKVKSEGLFMQSLNVGCTITLVIIVAIVILFIISIISS